MRTTAVFCHVAYFALYVAPIAFAVSFNLAYVYWLISGVAIATLVVWLWNASVWHRLLALAVNAGSSLATFVLASSLYVQGQGFNAQFFYHLDGENLRDRAGSIRADLLWYLGLLACTLRLAHVPWPA